MAQGCEDEGFSLYSLSKAMDFSHAGATEPAGVAFRAHVTWYDKGAKRNRNIYGPRRPDEEAAKDDLESMRTAARGMGREDGFRAMDTKAKLLRDDKAPKDQGSMDEVDGGYRADIQWLDEGC